MLIILPSHGLGASERGLKAHALYLTAHRTALLQSPSQGCLEPAKAAVATATLLAMGKLHGLLGGDVSFLPSSLESLK